MRFFHKFQSLNYDFLGLVNGILLNAKRKIKYTKTLDYIKKYSDVSDNIKISETSDKYQNKIWQLWLQGENNMPQIVKVCHNTVKKYHNNDIILLDKNNLKDYIKLPDYIEEKYKKGVITNAHYSDIIRLTLLAKYGGTWVDSTIYLTDKISDDVLSADFFTFKSVESENLKFIDNIEQFKIVSNYKNRILSIESPYFIRANSGNILINAVLNLINEYWKNENRLIDYLLIDKCFNLAVLNNYECKKIFLDMPTYYLENALLLQRCLFEKFDVDLFNNIKNLTSIHKLTHKNLHRNPYKDSFLNYLLNSEVF